MDERVELRNCIDCSDEFQAEYYETLGVKLLIGAGRCPKCRKIAYAEAESKEKADAENEILRRKLAARLRSGIPMLYGSKNFSTWEKGRGEQLDDAYKKCVKYAEDYPVGTRPIGYRSLYIHSEKSWGVGKTLLSCSIAHRLFERWQGKGKVPSVQWVSEPDLFSRIQASFNYTAEDKQVLPNADSIIMGCIKCDLLILDDVGKEKRQDSRFVQRTLFAIINGRYDNQLPMVMTANLTPTQLKEHLGTKGADEASYDRWMEMTQGKKVQMDGASYRRK